jgi:hypothetical protein
MTIGSGDGGSCVAGACGSGDGDTVGEVGLDGVVLGVTSLPAMRDGTFPLQASSSRAERQAGVRSMGSQPSKLRA